MSSFESVRGTFWLFATVGIYTFGALTAFWLLSTRCIDSIDFVCENTFHVPGAQMISTLFILFPCFEGADEKMMVCNLYWLSIHCLYTPLDLKTMVCNLYWLLFTAYVNPWLLVWKVHDPTSACYSYTTLMWVTPIGICFYMAVMSYVLGYAFWAKKGGYWLFVVDLTSNSLTAHCVLLMPIDLP